MADDSSFIEKRSYPRFPVMISTNCLFAESEDKVDGLTHDISASGLGLFTDKELPVGTGLEITLSMADNAEEVRLKGVVVWSRKSSLNGYRVGIKLEGHTLKPIPLVLRTIDYNYR